MGSVNEHDPNEIAKSWRAAATSREAEPMLAPDDAIRIKLERCRRLLFEQLHSKPRFHSRPQECGRQKNIHKAVHDSRMGCRADR